MKNKFLIVVFSLLFVLSCFGLASCAHNHNFGEDWKSDGTNHWHECECGEKKDVSAHDFGAEWQKNATEHWRECECGYKDAAAHTFGTDWEISATEHRRECACGYEEVSAHTFVDGKCNICKVVTGTSAFEFSADDKTIIALKDKTATAAIIPVGVTAIGERAFYKCTALKSVIIPNGVTNIGTDAFRLCEGLTSAAIPDGVISIGDYAFYGNGFTSVTVPDSVERIGMSAFGHCLNLTSVNIGSGAAYIGSNAFSSCISLESITVDPGNTAYYSEQNCVMEESSKTLVFGCKNSVIPQDVKRIYENAFFGHTGLKSVVIPGGVTDIGVSAFAGCSGLESIAVDSENEKYYSEQNCLIERSTKTLVAGCKNSVIPQDIRAIGDNAFNGCTDLTSIVIPSSVTSIGKRAFYHCAGLTSIIIPSNVTSIGYMSFFFCDKLTNIELEDPDGWTATKRSSQGDSIELTSEELQEPQIAAQYFKDDYADYDWTKAA